ncbi:MAG: hypothetical protein RMJ56_09055 [Gemmataceae bacterium]|nr:hypothetical protein [Gemmata sp.]MDW8197735.1 hypothetical protein [Gemmataceae bacterium]
MAASVVRPPPAEEVYTVALAAFQPAEGVYTVALAAFRPAEEVYTVALAVSPTEPSGVLERCQLLGSVFLPHSVAA